MSEPIARGMLCDDQPIVGEAVRQMLADYQDVVFIHVTSSQEVRDQLPIFEPTVLLQDLLLETQSGIDVVKEIRSSTHHQDLPIILLSTTDDAMVKFEAFAAGASDYVVKFPERFELIGRILYHSRAYQNLKEREKAQRQLSQRSRLESLGTLAAGIAHEINTPLQYVSGNLSFLHTALEEFKTSTAHADMVGAIDDCIDGVKRIAEIVRAMKAFSHPGSQEKTPVELNTLLEQVGVLSRNEWKDYAVLTTDLQTDLPAVPCIQGSLVQVLLNIIVNAAHALKDKRPKDAKIHLGTRRTSSGVAITITDNGGGIPEAIQARIFDPFFTTKEVGSGSGQGLAIARSIVEEGHKGKLTFSSTPEVGTTFTIELPV